ncbi:9844_t:CDS:2 [Funneliformis geosporum]|uniref:9844_t:CDS:1 n=1 Tax=Funneliformis geosporum TaxID=1117311 RepID=A0A9W4T1V3_9GLOM|nr:9844_t:CDS:2 [Funneliformis geosporum]
MEGGTDEFIYDEEVLNYYDKIGSSMLRAMKIKPTKGLVKDQIFELDLNKGRPYFAIEENEKYLLVLTLTTNDEEKPKKNKKDREGKPSFSRFGPIKCDCLSEETYIRLETKIFITREFIKDSKLELFARNNKINHQCLSEPQYLELRETLDAY